VLFPLFDIGCLWKRRHAMLPSFLENLIFFNNETYVRGFPRVGACGAPPDRFWEQSFFTVFFSYQDTEHTEMIRQKIFVQIVDQIILEII
jgi:hypothetical protein